MARVKVSEHSLYQLLQKHNLPTNKSYAASATTTKQDLAAFFGDSKLVVKVDQGIKKRGLQGLVRVNISASEAISVINKWHLAGWSHFIVVPFLPHEQESEHYLSLELTRSGWRLIWGERGGIEVEQAWDQTKTGIVGEDMPHLPVPVQAIIQPLVRCMQESNLVFLECNPLVIISDVLHPLDLAGLVDDAISTHLTLVQEKDVSHLETQVARLDASTPASLKCRLINSDGSIWMLLSGGGASLVIADEVADQGLGKSLGNYGEYSGSPTTEDTEQYAGYILDAMLTSTAPRKALIVAGGVANFTDVKKTFLGVISALHEREQAIIAQGIKVFVRRGGPNEVQGLGLMRSYLQDSGLLGSVYGHEIVLTQVVHDVIKFLGNKHD
jgi:ATP-citrate lyase beta-subunit